jgi:hypothetical protein
MDIMNSRGAANGAEVDDIIDAAGEYCGPFGFAGRVALGC